MTPYAELRERVVAANVEIVRAGLVVLTFGNASAADREAGVIAILDLATGAVVAGAHRPSSDTPTHLALYRAFDGIGGIVHTHSPFATAWAQARREIPCLGTTHADHFRGTIPVTRLLSADEIAAGYEEQTGAVIVETFAELGLDPLAMPAVLVASHGPFAWGADATGAVENAVALELVAASAYRALLIRSETGSIQDELLEKHFDRKHGAAAYYGQPR